MRRGLTFAVTMLAILAMQSQAASAQEPNQVTGLTAVQRDGFTTLAWNPVAGATTYQIERTPVDDANQPTGPAVITGVWEPLRTVTPNSPRFADAGYSLGDRFQWRVRARFGTETQPFSEPVFGTTLPQWGTGPGASLRTEWESSNNATFTSDAGEYGYTAALDAASERVRVVELGRTNPVPSAPEGRPINMVIIGAPAPPATPQAISSSPTIVFNCNVHGNEPQGRESCLIFARMLAFTDDPHLLEVLDDITVLIVPTINGNGRAADTRGNETGADLNRDYAELLQPETKAFVAMLRDYTPEVGIDLHEGDSEDMPILSSRHLNVHEEIFNEGKRALVEGWMYDAAAQSGWWMGPYSNGGDSHEGILRNTFGLKNIVGMLAENRASGGTTRPAEAGNQLANRHRKSYGSLWEEFQSLEYYWTRLDQIHGAVERAIAFQRSNSGRVVLRGSYPWGADPRFPAHPLPNEDAPTAERILDPAPCGYFLTDEEFSADRPGGSVELRLGVHGIAQQTRPAGHIVRMIQAQRGLIPTLLDAQAVDPEPILATQRLSECPHVNAFPRDFSVVAAEDTEQTDTLTIANVAAEPDEPLNWTITEAVSDCDTPTDLPWVSTSRTSGTTPSGAAATDVDVTFDGSAVNGPATRSGVLCLSTNDVGEPTIVVTLDYEVRDLRVELQDIADELWDRLPLRDKQDSRDLRDAVDALDDATRTRDWDGGGHLDNGNRVFNATARAIRNLDGIRGSWVDDAIEAIAAIDRDLAQIAIDEAPDGSRKDRAEDELERGDDLVDDGEFERAVRRYEAAWEIVS